MTVREQEGEMTHTDMPSQSLLINMLSQDDTDATMPSQSQSVEMVSQGSQAEMLVSCAVMEPEEERYVLLERAFEEMDGIEFS